MKQRKIEGTAVKYLTSYLLIGLVPVLILGLLLCITQFSAMRQTRLEAVTRQANQISSAFEKRISDLNVIAAQYTSDHLALDGDDISMQLQTYLSGYNLPGNLFLYQHGSNNIWADSGLYAYSEFESQNNFGGELDFISFFKKINTSVSTLFYASQSPSGASNYFIVMVPVPYLDASPVSTLIYIEPLSQTDLLITDYLGDFTGAFSIQDETGRMIYLSVNNLSLPVDAVQDTLMRLNGTQVISGQVENEKCTFIRLISIRNFKYTYMLPNRTLFRQENMQLLYSLLALATLLLLVVFLCMVLTRRQVKPLHALYAEISQTPESMLYRLDVVSQLRTQYDAMQEENASMASQLQNYTSIARQHLLNDLLHGRITTLEQLETQALSADLRFEYPVVYVAVVSLCAADGHAGLANQVLPAFYECHRPDMCAYGTETDQDNTLALVINSKKGENGPMPPQIECVQGLLAILPSLGITPLQVGISAPHSSPLRLNQSLIEALTAMQEDSSGIHLYKREEDIQQDTPYEIYELFRQSLLSGDSTIAQSILARLNQRFCEKENPLSIQQAFCFKLVNIVLEAAQKYHVELDQMELSLLAAHGNPNELSKVLEPCIRRICRHKLEAEQSISKQQSDAMLRYIYDHFSDSMLTLEQLAEAFSISTSYTRKIIKEATGMTFTNYLSALRFNKVKQLLSDTQLPVKDIIEATGYIDVSSFTRKFKVQVGITPGQYRELAQKDGR